MCGRFVLSTSAAVLARHFQLSGFPELRPRYNIAPTQEVPVVRDGADGREVAMLRWGLVPSWATDLKIGHSLINARSETVAEKPSFRSAFKNRRCLIPANAFYEWQPQGKQKQPWLFRLHDGEPFAFAGLWERWTKGEKPVETFTLLTTEANDIVRPVHDRMPVILPGRAYETWLDPQVKTADTLLSLLKPYPAALMTAVPVSPRVNNPKFEGPGCVVEVALA